jgi:uncharacterized protein (DUF2126 family)
MGIRVAVSHATRYDYASPAALSPQVVRLRPAPHNRTPVHSYSLRVTPDPHFVNWQQDPHGNYLARLVFPEKVPHFEVRIDLVLDLEPYNPFDFFLEPQAEEFPFEYSVPQAKDLEPYLRRAELGPKLREFLGTLNRERQRSVDFLVDTNRRLTELVQYVIRMEPGVQTPEQTLTLQRGSCRDSAWLLVQALRHLGLAARFVSGYLVQLKPDSPPVEGPPGPASDFTDLHAWCECYLPGAGWVGLDPTSGLLTAEGHVPVACSPDPAGAAPIEGAVDKVETRFSFEMQVSRLIDVPRVTKPYSEEQWKHLLAVGERVDADLRTGDVRLTMGGEPTYVSTREPDAPEWNTDALGGNKQALADRMLRSLQPEWCPGGVLFHGQGKWYPGEQLPRWALGCYARTDGVPLWRNTAWFGRDDENYGHTSADAERFARELITQLGLTRHGLLPGYEDVWYYLWRERRLPANVDVLDSRLDDATERERLRRVFQQGLSHQVGWALPLAYDDGWYSGDFFLRSQHCFLLPGDSPMGFRLPLDSLPWLHQSELGLVEPDPTLEQPPLPTRFDFPRPARSEGPARPRVQPRDGSDDEGDVIDKWGHHAHTKRDRWRSKPAGSTLESPFSAPARYESASGSVRTALCVEPREGRLRVFLPPLPSLEAFVELMAALERCCEVTRLRVQLEGYPPVRDARLRTFQITPDPGVIEVNVPPVERFTDLVGQMELLDRVARENGLASEKFDLDGAHIGSGGGHHLVMGAKTSLDSPFLRRPDVLASLITYLNNHPSLSYLFAGRFIGPTSQAPRVDEARHESLHELEIAFQHLRQRRQHAELPHPPWLVDRILRHLLVDVTGNTHRTEVCIDKLYAPESSTGRLGLIELRGFEMAPHARMSVAQQLLLRGLIAAFWRTPYDRELVTWGTSLHDKFLLPRFAQLDFLEVLADLRRWGYPLSFEHFEPHYQFRFPYYGSIVRDAIELELRGALEPWSVLGEEATAGGQARFVDSSLERLQVKLKNAPGDRYLVCCNGTPVPLHDTGIQGEKVAGVRYRAWCPPSCLHPTIGIHGPLHFEIYDRWNQRAIAGCTYHVVHPGGRAAEQRPVNAVAAESRRLARFDRAGHTPGIYVPQAREARHAGVDPSYPMTLDLRRL